MEKLFLSIGAMKAGTTWLYSLLERHPQINFTPEKKFTFWPTIILTKNI